MKKILENVIQKELKIIEAKNDNVINIIFIADDDFNQITKYIYNKNTHINKIVHRSSLYDDDGDIISFTTKYSICKYFYKIINDKKMRIKRICKYPNNDTRIYEYHYNEKGQEIENVLNGKVTRVYEYEYDKLKLVKHLDTNDSYEYKYKDGYKLIYCNNKIYYKGKDNTSIYYNNNDKLKFIKEFNNKNQLIKYTTPNNIITYKYDNLDRIVEIKINDTINIVEYKDYRVIVKSIQ